MSEKTYPDSGGYDPTVGMGEDIQKFEYIVWFKGEYVKAHDIAKAISTYLETRDVKPITANYGTYMVPTEDIGHGPQSLQGSAING